MNQRRPKPTNIQSAPFDQTQAFSHVLLLMDDAKGRVLDSLTEKRERLETLYDFSLMQGGGQICGRLVAGEDAAALDRVLAEYEAETASRFAETGRAPLLYAVGDGNHSLATAKTCWEALKAQDPSLAGSQHPARYAMVELQNIRDAEQKFEPIHRLLLDVSKGALLQALEPVCGRISRRMDRGRSARHDHT